MSKTTAKLDKNTMDVTGISRTSLAPKSSSGSHLRKIWQRSHSASPFGSNVALTLGTNLVIAIAGLVTGPLCARLLGPAGRGELAAVQNLYWLVAGLAVLGMPEAALYFTAQRLENRGRVLSSAVLLALPLLPLFGLAAYHFAPILLAAQSASVIRTARLCLFGLPLYALVVVPAGALRGDRELVGWNFTRVLPVFGWLALLLVAPLFSTPSPRTLAFGYLGVLAIAIMPTLIVAHRKISGSFAPELAMWPRMLKYGIPVAGSTIPNTLNLRLDQMLMAALLPARTLGLYVAAVSWSSAVAFVLVAVSTVLFPRIARTDGFSRGTILSQGTRIAMFMAVILAGLVAILTPFAIPLLFGQEFRASVPVGILLTVAGAISGMNMCFQEGLLGLGEPLGVFWGEMSGLLITCVSLVLFLRPFGLVGAGLASIFGYSTTAIVALSIIIRRTNCSLTEMLIIKRDDMTLVWRKILEMRASIRENKVI